MNLHIVNGLGATNGEPGDPTDTSSPVVNGLGNLIIGYNGTRGTDGGGASLDKRTGSHNLITGDQNNYESYGGVVIGFQNDTFSGAYSSILGGQYNETVGNFSAILGGRLNFAGADNAVVTGGYNNNATGVSSTVTGGESNQAGGDYSSVSGGNGVSLSSSATDAWAAGTLHSP